MNLVTLDKIIISPNRQRQDFDPQRLQELCDSIAKVGLQHAPVMRVEGDRCILVAGERRLRAIKQIFELGGMITYDGTTFGPMESQAAVRGMIPFVTLGELSLLDAEEAELDENLKRADLTWQEHAAAVARLHKLREYQKGLKAVQEGKIGQSLPDYPLQSVADTAQELLGRSDGDYQQKVREEIIVAKHLDNPLITRATSAKEAMKILKADEQRKKDEQTATRIGATFTADVHTVQNEDCIFWMQRFRMEPESLKFDVLLCDPPYGMGADSFGDGGGKLTGIQHHYDDSYESWQKLIAAFAPLSFEVTKTQAHAYIFCDFDNFHELKKAMEAAGWYVFRTPLTVIKRNSGRVPLPDQGPRRQTEWVLYAIKGKKPVTHIYPDIVESSADEQLGHGAQKPVAVYQNLLQRSCRPGDRVADFFAGTGPIIPAAHAMKCYATAVEVDKANYARCVKRVQDLAALNEADPVLAAFMKGV